MASIRKRGNSYLLVVSMGYAPDGRRRNPQQKTVKPPTGLTPKQTEKWLQEQAMLFEMSCKKLNPGIDRSITLEKYTEIWLQTIAPDKLAKSTLVREKQDIEHFKPYLGSYKLVDLRPEHFRSLYTKLRKQKNKARKIKRQERHSPKRRLKVSTAVCATSSPTRWRAAISIITRHGGRTSTRVRRKRKRLRMMKR